MPYDVDCGSAVHVAVRLYTKSMTYVSTVYICMYVLPSNYTVIRYTIVTHMYCIAESELEHSFKCIKVQYISLYLGTPSGHA